MARERRLAAIRRKLWVLGLFLLFSVAILIYAGRASGI